MRSKVINVTQKDIELGERGSSTSCPVARAIRRAFKKSAKSLRLTVVTHRILKSNGSMDLDGTPIPSWIKNFDSENRQFDVKPISFILEY
jgi:hypothetical protein